MLELLTLRYIGLIQLGGAGRPQGMSMSMSSPPETELPREPSAPTVIRNRLVVNWRRPIEFARHACLYFGKLYTLLVMRQ